MRDGDYILGNNFNGESRVVSPDYQDELYGIREKIKEGHCSTLRQCLLLFEGLLAESRRKNPLISHQFQKKIDMLSQKDPKQYSNVLKKMDQITRNPLHYKPLSGDLHGSRRAHVGDFVIIYGMNEDGIVFIDYNHHDRVYNQNK